MRNKIKSYSIVILMVTCCFLYSQEEPVGHGEKTFELIDVKSWNNPIKKIFKKYKLPLNKVVYYGHDKYPVFFTYIPWDPMTQPNSNLLRRIEVEIFLANNKDSFAIQDEGNKIRIEMSVKDKRSLEVEENIIVLEGGEID